MTRLNSVVMGVVAWVCGSSLAWGAESFVVKDIRVEGIQRTEVGTVYAYLPIKVGDRLSDELNQRAVKALYATGFFKDVRLEADGDVLVVYVEERPAIRQIEFSGVKEFKPEDLKKALKDVGLAESRIFDRALLDRAEQELKQQYLNKGKYAAEVSVVVTPEPNNLVSVRFDVTENDAAKIRQIRIIGAQAFPETVLLSQLQLREPNWFSWYTKNDQYSRQKLSADLETLRSFYQNRGYIEFSVESAQVSISADKRDIFIAIVLEEGKQFKISEINFAGNARLSKEELQKLSTISVGDIFARNKVTQTTQAISERLGKDGYAFASVGVLPDINRQNDTVALTLNVDPGRRMYVRRVNMSGNVTTHDNVIRREFRQQESGWYDSQALNRSKERLDRLGFFSDVNFETLPVTGVNDQVDVNVKVAERSTGSIQAGIGISSSEKLILSAGISQSNLFGSGDALAFQLNTSKINRIMSLSYTTPYVTADGVTQSIDVYHRNYDSTALSNVAKYKSASTGVGLRYGIPLSEVDSISVGVTPESVSISAVSDSPQRYLDYVKQFGATNTALIFSGGWARDSRDSLIYPTKGLFRRALLEATAPMGSQRYYKITVQEQHYIPLTSSVSWMLSATAAMGKGFGGRPLPFFRNFFAGGIGSVRSYATSSLGPRDLDGALGGDREVVLSSEVLFPFPSAGLDKSLRLSWYVDSGQVFGPGDQLGRFNKFSMRDLRYSTGIGLSWLSPVGPLRFSFGTPIGRREGGSIQRFQFTMGTVF